MNTPTLHSLESARRNVCRRQMHRAPGHPLHQRPVRRHRGAGDHERQDQAEYARAVLEQHAFGAIGLCAHAQTRWRDAMGVR